MGLIISITVFASWRTPITKYKPKSPEERELSQLFIKYITSRNNREVKPFLSTLHRDCKYMVTKDFIAGKDELKAMLPGLWMQNDDKASIDRCMTWECIHENFYQTVMLINPKFRISGQQAKVDFKIVSGIFMDDNSFHIVKDKDTWLITQFMRPFN